MKIQVAVATMGQKDVSLYNIMNIKADAIIANQTDFDKIESHTVDGFYLQMISTKTKGVGINRNIAISFAKGDIILFADDDVIYYDDAFDNIQKAFDEIPDADVMIFGLDYTKDGKVFDKRHCKTQRLRLYNALKYGGARIAVKREALLKNNIYFSTLFGGGCIYCSGEDSIFLCDVFRAGLKVYSSSYVIGTCAKDNSSWFEGYNEKYMFDKGAFIRCAFPKSKHLMKWYFAYKFSKKSKLTFTQTVKLMNKGMKAFEKLKPFNNEDK